MLLRLFRLKGQPISIGRLAPLSLLKVTTISLFLGAGQTIRVLLGLTTLWMWTSFQRTHRIKERTTCSLVLPFHPLNFGTWALCIPWGNAWQPLCGVRRLQVYEDAEVLSFSFFNRAWNFDLTMKPVSSLTTLVGRLAVERLSTLVGVTLTRVMFTISATCGSGIGAWLALKLKSNLRICCWVCYMVARVGISCATMTV